MPPLPKPGPNDETSGRGDSKRARISGGRASLTNDRGRASRSACARLSARDPPRSSVRSRSTARRRCCFGGRKLPETAERATRAGGRRCCTSGNASISRQQFAYTDWPARAEPNIELPSSDPRRPTDVTRRRVYASLLICPTRDAPIAAQLASSAENVWCPVSIPSSSITADNVSAAGVRRNRSSVEPGLWNAVDLRARTAGCDKNSHPIVVASAVSRRHLDTAANSGNKSFPNRHGDC